MTLVLGGTGLSGADIIAAPVLARARCEVAQLIYVS